MSKLVDTDTLIADLQETADNSDGTITAFLCRLVCKDIAKAPEAIIRCNKCKYASGDSRICTKTGYSPIGELDFCSWAERIEE